MIRIEKLNQYYNRHKRNENHVLRDLSLTLPERGLVAIFGRSGCGKTTLLSVIGGMDIQSSGSITYLDRDTRRENDRYRNETVGYVFQSYLLQSNATVYENVAAALYLIGITDPETVERRVSAALSAVGMERYRNRLPGTLSGGQQQRVAIARAIVKNPPVLLADEPTGNLDEANTVAIMELLRAISREHLVLLVTHEEDLVLRYADRIITLSDGEVVSDRENLETMTDTPKDARKIYLGDLPRESQSVGGVRLCRYGEGGGEIALTLVTKGGETYLRVDSGRVHLLDESSELSLVEGKYEPQKSEKREAAMNMADLPRVSGKHFGRLYGWKAALLGALRTSLGRHRRRDRALRLALALFAVAAVFLTAIFGTAIGAYRDLESGYSHSTIYVYTPYASVSRKLLSDQAKEAGTIESVRLINTSYVMGDSYYDFRPPAFETYHDDGYYGGISTNAVLLPMPISEELELVCGKRAGLGEQEILLTTAAADRLLSESTAGYLKDYPDLLGIALTSLSAVKETPRVVGIVKSSERAIYLSEMALARLAWEDSRERVAPASDYGYTVADGEALFATASENPPVNGALLTLRDEKLTLLGRVATPLGLVHDRYLLSDADYVRLADRCGNSSACFYSHRDRGGEPSTSTSLRVTPATWYCRYSVLHVKDLEKAREYLTLSLGEDHPAPDEYSPGILYPEDAKVLLTEDVGAEAALGFIWLAVALILLSLSVSLLMRSTLLSRVKEVGILRAIGVSRRNLLFRFTVESAVLALSTVFLGFLAASIFVAACLRASPITAAVFFYPPWLAIPLLLLLLFVSIFFGVLPLRRLLTPSPGRILAKYDV